ncbi:MAG: S8/S53 family peptidase [Spirochaetales bacterium]|nr:S8/S53 family peptidase [Spirochaetales bacterium]
MRRIILQGIMIGSSCAIGFILCMILRSEPRIPYIHYSKGNSHPTYFTIHKIRKGWDYSKGKGVKIGILDHNFGIDDYSLLYSGYYDARKDKSYREIFENCDHGYWMASTLHEIAPEAEIYAIGITTTHEDIFVQELEDAISWAIEKEIDILTYSQARLSEDARKELKPILDKAYSSGIITCFLHFPNPRNILPSDIDPSIEGIDNSADFGVYNRDYSVLLPSNLKSKNNQIELEGYNPFLSVSSKPIVTAGIIAMMVSAAPEIDRIDIEGILKTTSYNFEDEEHYLENAIDAKAAIEYSMAHY